MTSRSFALILALLIAGCAAVKPPPGGDEDKTPPDFEEVTPAPQSLNVPRNAKLHFNFTHNVDRNSFTNAITITPYMSGVVKYDWSGWDEVTVNLPDSLRANTTYIVTLTKDFKTMRGGPLTSPYQLLFSTGPVIDTGIISGSILPPLTVGAPVDLKNVSVFAYDLTDISADTLDVASVRPDYITQPSDKGFFEFRGMKTGHRYRMFAIIDEFRNHVFDRGMDAYGMPMSDITLSSTLHSGIRIRMVPKTDTTRPQLQDWEMPDVYHLRARFSKSLDSNSVLPEHFKLVDSISGARVPIVSAYRANIEKAGGVVTLVLGAPVLKSTVYQLTVTDGVHDLANNDLDSSAAQLWVHPLTARDTFAAPHFGGIAIGDSTRGIAPEFDEVVSFSDAVDTAAFERGLKLLDSSGHSVPIEFTWLDGIRVRLAVEHPLHPREWYRFEQQLNLVRPPMNVSFAKAKDTEIVTRFFTGDVTEYGVVSGSVISSDSSGSVGRIVVRLVSSDGSISRRRILPPGVHDYVFDNVPRNTYSVQAWLTTHDDGSYDGGSPVPLRFALPSGDYPDVIDVRPKWTLEHIDIQLQ